jgi:hypothetical protein
MKPQATLDLIYANPTQAARIALGGKFTVLRANVSGRSNVSQSVYLDVVVADEQGEDGERIVELRISDHDAGRTGLGGNIDRRFSDIFELHPAFDLAKFTEDMEDDWAYPSFQDEAWGFKS